MTADKSCATCTHANSDMICVNLNSEHCGQAVCERDSCDEWKGESMSEIENAIQILRDSNAKLKQCMSRTPSEAYAIDGYETLEKCQAEYDAVELAIQALQEKHDRENPKPLTLEQLRERDGKPVWAISLDADGNQDKSEWYIINSKKEEIVDNKGYHYPFDCMGKSCGFIAYDRPPKEESI